MKLKHVVAAVLAAMSASAFGASITVTNTNGPVATRSIVDNAGNAIDGGYAAIGNISDEARLESPLTGSDLDGLFTLFDGAEGPLNSAPFAGTFSVQSAGGILLNAPNNDWSGSPIYLVLGNGSSLSDSTEAAVLKVGTFGNSEPTLSTTIINEDSDVLFGVFNATFNPSGLPPAANNPALRLGPLVPEPSSSLLIGLAGLTLLVRRKR